MLSHELYYLFFVGVFVIAFAHSSVGLGGGSSYTALMAIVGIPTPAIPTLSLSLNTLVSTIGAATFIHFKHFDWRLWLPLQLSALPFVFIGAQVVLPTQLFYGLLLVTLLFSLTRLCIQHFNPHASFNTTQPQPNSHLLPRLVIGACIGFLSGSLGIGGGIYLIPCLILLGIATTKQAAAIGIVFIFTNSIIGLITKWHYGLIDQTLLMDFITPALIAVGVGGFLGAWIGASLWSERTTRLMLIVVMSAACFLLARKMLLA